MTTWAIFYLPVTLSLWSWSLNLTQIVSEWTSMLNICWSQSSSSKAIVKDTVTRLSDCCNCTTEVVSKKPDWLVTAYTADILLPSQQVGILLSVDFSKHEEKWRATNENFSTVKICYKCTALAVDRTCSRPYGECSASVTKHRSPREISRKVQMIAQEHHAMHTWHESMQVVSQQVWRMGLARVCKWSFVRNLLKTCLHLSRENFYKKRKAKNTSWRVYAMGESCTYAKLSDNWINELHQELSSHAAAGHYLWLKTICTLLLAAILYIYKSLLNIYKLHVLNY